MPCPFGTTFYIFFDSLSDALALTVTAPLTRRRMMAQVWGDKDGSTAFATADVLHVPFYQGWWQGNGWGVVYSALFQAMTVWGTNRVLHQMSRYKKGNGNEDKAKKGSDLDWMENQKAKLVAQCVSMTILYPLTKVITIVTTSASSTTAMTTTTTPAALTILMDAVSSQGVMLGLYGGLGSMVASHVQYQIAYHGMLLWWTKIRRPQRINQTAESDGTSPKTLTTIGWARLVQWSYSHLHWVMILSTATCFSYPLETSSRRRQVSTTKIPDMNNDVNLWAGVGYAILTAMMHHVLLGVFTSESCSIFFRRVMMKLFH